MGNWLNKMERKYGNYAIPELTRVIIITYLIGYLAEFVRLTPFISLNPYLIMRGQIWRLVTWIIMPPSDFSISTIIMLFFYFSIGTSLERTWGTFRYNFYMFSGVLFTLIGAFVAFFIGSAMTPEFAEAYGNALSYNVSTYFIVNSMFFAFAASFPDLQIYLYFLIPIKVKWLAWLDGVYIIWMLIISPWYGRIIVISSLLNFVFFYLSTRKIISINPGETQRRNAFRRNFSSAQRTRRYSGNDGRISKHKCAVCGRTELDDPTLEFRFCSKCNGNYEYCNDHLYTHTHVQ